MTNFISKYYNHPIAFVLYALIIGVIIYFIGKSLGTIKQAKLPGDEDWGKALTVSESKTVRETVMRIHKDLDSYLVSVGLRPRDTQAYYDLNNFTDKMFVASYNDFNTLYFDKNKDNGTLTQWIDDELGLDGDIKKILAQRFAKHNLK